MSLCTPHSTPCNLRIRPIQERDLDGLIEVAKAIGGGLTSLPNDPDFLRQKINASLRAFDPRVESAGSDHYLFVLEDIVNGRIAGTSGILARVGGFEPFYSYQIVREKIQHEPLEISLEMPVLNLKRSYAGPSEVCTLVLHPAYRMAGLARLLSLCRFIFMACFPDRFEKTVLAELRGVLDERGRSPFWEAVIRPFFQQDFLTADCWSGLGHKQFIEDLMPKYPLYIPLLPKEAQEVIGKVHHCAEGAYHILINEGFLPTDQVYIFDAGPILESAVKDVRTVKACRRASVIIQNFRDESQQAVTHIIAKPSLEFRACLGTILQGDSMETITISSAVADNLELQHGDSVVYVPLKSVVF